MTGERNVGTMDAYIRITLGLSALTWASMGKAGRWGGLVTLLGAMKVAQGVTRHCPLLRAMGTTTLESVIAPHEAGEQVDPKDKVELPNPFASDP